MPKHLLLTGFAMVAVALWAGCGGAPSEIAPPAANQQALRQSWMRSTATQGALLYVSDEYVGTVFVYSYPDLTPVGKLTGFKSAAGLCVDSKTGNIWVTDPIASKIVEFAHGGTTPIKRLKEDAGWVQACAVNPKNGDLAIVNNFIFDDSGNLSIYSHAQGKPAVYYNRHMFYYDFVAYDGAGNAFVDGVSGPPFRLAELPSGGTKLQNVPWSGPNIKSPGGLQYHAASLAIGDTGQPVIYQTSNGMVTGTTTLKKACSVEQFFIDGRRLIAPNTCGKTSNVLIYSYPAGGAPFKTLTGFKNAFGAVVSVSP